MIKNEKDIIHRQVQLLNAQIPYSFYVINYTNNLFRFTTVPIAPTILTATVPVGNYTANSLISTLKGVIDAAIGDTSSVIAIDSISGKMTFAYQYQWTIYNNFTYSIGNVLGLEPNSINTGIPLAMSIVYASYPLNLLGIKILQVRSANLIMNNVSSVHGGQTTLLQSIPVSAVPFGMIDFTDKGQNLITVYNDFLDDLDIDIVDGESGEYINFNNQDWCITLAIHLTRRMEPAAQGPAKGSSGPDFTGTAFAQGTGLTNAPDLTPLKTPTRPQESPDMQQLNILSS